MTHYIHSNTQFFDQKAKFPVIRHPRGLRRSRRSRLDLNEYTYSESANLSGKFLHGSSHKVIVMTEKVESEAKWTVFWRKVEGLVVKLTVFRRKLDSPTESRRSPIMNCFCGTWIVESGRSKGWKWTIQGMKIDGPNSGWIKRWRLTFQIIKVSKQSGWISTPFEFASCPNPNLDYPLLVDWDRPLSSFLITNVLLLTVHFHPFITAHAFWDRPLSSFLSIDALLRTVHFHPFLTTQALFRAV